MKSHFWAMPPVRIVRNLLYYGLGYLLATLLAVGCGGSGGSSTEVPTTGTVTITLRSSTGAVVNGFVTLIGVRKATVNGAASFLGVPVGTRIATIEADGLTFDVVVDVAAGTSTTPVTVAPTPTPVPSPSPQGTPPALPFDLRGRVRVSGVPTDGITVRVVGTGAVTAAEETVTNSGGVYAFLLGAGNYTVTATQGSRGTSRTVTIPSGGQTVDNFDLNL